MDKTVPFPMPRHRPECEVVILRPLEHPRQDMPLVAHAFADRSQREAEDMLCAILEGIADWLDLLQQGLAAGNHGMIGKPARRIALVAGQIGLTDVAIAADHVVQCATRGDRHALAATIGRLERAFDIAVTKVWDFRDP
ncbi:hypothetical protein [Yoonia vestfoldensis]|uniref:hypothetical protein n=1 Tax=Yoonia vestfoldensis TaxID=245188 RepID=UPI00037FB36B|nr:hypothetical protein [Yoonia vestfoldensis]